MIRAFLQDGWIRVGPYTGPELGRVEIGLGDEGFVQYNKAFMHTVNGEKVAQVRPNGALGPSVNVWLRIDGVPVLIGYLGADPALTQGRRQRRG